MQGCFWSIRRADRFSLAVSHFLDDEFVDNGLPIGHEAPVVVGKAGQVRKLHPLHRRLDPAERVAPDHDLVGAEDQTEPLPLFLSLTFGEDKLGEREQQRASGGSFDSESTCVGVTRPAFGWFGGVHGVEWLI